MGNKVRVKVKVFNEEGYWLLNEIRGLKEGTIIEGVANPHNKGIDFKWNGGDAVLWLGTNCVLCKKRNRLNKGTIMDIYWFAYSNSGKYIDGASSKHELLELMSSKGYSREEYKVICQATEYHVKEDYYGDNFGEGETRKEAIRDFWENFKAY